MSKFTNKGYVNIIKNKLKNPSNFQEFIKNWNVFIQEFLKSRPKEVQNKLLFIKPIDKKLAINKDERFHITTRNQFIKNWANKVDKSQSIFVNLYLFANRWLFIIIDIIQI